MLHVLRWFRQWRSRQKNPPVTTPSMPSEAVSAPRTPAVGHISRTTLAESPAPPSTARQQRIPLSPPTVPGTADTIQDADWAQRQGRKDRATGVACWTYAAFLATYGLPKNPSSLRLWAAYMPLGEQHLPARGRTRMPDRAVPRARPPAADTMPGLSALREKELRNQGAKAQAQSNGVVTFRVAGRAVEQIRMSGASRAARYAAEFNASVLQLRVNPPDTLNDAWR